MAHIFSHDRYEHMVYNRCGRSGLLLPAVSLGLWHNFGEPDDFETSRELIRTSFDLGITHFDLANNYGPPAGAAESRFGALLQKDLHGYRDELIISTKAGYGMWPGPYGNFGSRKYLLASLDRSLQRMGLEYVDIFYHHRPDPETPLEETMGALDHAVRQGKALYVGISNYGSELTRQAVSILNNLGTPCLISQPKYNLLERSAETALFDTLEQLGIGCIVFSPLAQGQLSDKYLEGIPGGSRASKAHSFLKPEYITPEKIHKIRKLNEIAGRRGQSLAQMALSWILSHRAVTSVLIGASRVEHITENIAALRTCSFSTEECASIDRALS